MKGIILAGGSGKRLYPMTLVTSKQLLPVYDKPMIYYPLSTLMWAGIREILLISTPRDLPNFQGLLGDGRQFGLALSYVAQPSPDGLPQAFLLGEEFLAGDGCAMILGDNLFAGEDLGTYLAQGFARAAGATLFDHLADHPERLGVVERDEGGDVVGLEEKPPRPKSRYALTGLYCFDGSVCRRAGTLKPSRRGELEIVDLARTYLDEGTLEVVTLGPTCTWMDMGTPQSLSRAARFVEDRQSRRGRLLGAPEAVACQKGWIGPQELEKAAARYGQSPYGAALRQEAEANRRETGL